MTRASEQSSLAVLALYAFVSSTYELEESFAVGRSAGSYDWLYTMNAISNWASDFWFAHRIPEVDVEARSDRFCAEAVMPLASRLSQRGGARAIEAAYVAATPWVLDDFTRLAPDVTPPPELGQLRQQCLEALRADYRIDPEAGGRTDDERAIVEEARGLARAWHQAAVAG